MSAVKLIKEEFNASFDELKALTPQDRAQLGTAIALGRGLTQSDVNFEFQTY
jgi:hypothetical protein